MSDYISREQLINEWDDLGRRYAMPTSPIHKRAFREFPSANAISIDQANAMIKSYVSHYEENNGDFDEMTNREIISEFVERDDSFAIMVDEVNGTVNIELSLDFWNSPYKKGGE